MTRQEFCNAAKRLFDDVEKGSISIEMEEGDILSLCFDNPSSKETIIQMIEAQGDEILSDKTEDGKIYLEIEKG